MAAVLQPSSTTSPYYPPHPTHHAAPHRRHQKRGILLPSAHQPTNSPYISSSSASSSSSHTSLTNTPLSSAPSSRRIRFAPLPDPRRLVIINDDGTETPLPEDATHYPSAFATNDEFPDADNESLSSSGSASKRNSFNGDSAVSTPGTMTPISTSPEDTLNPGFPAALTASLTKSSGSSSLTKSLLFRPWSKKSSTSSSSSTYSLTPTASHDHSSCTKGTSFPRMNISTEEILTLGTINLFRASSRDRDGDNTSGWSLQRWTSAGSGKEPTPSWGAPLTRSQSSQSYKGRKSSFLSLPSPLSGSSSTKSKPKPRPTASSLNSRHTGTRMLNGRIYGGPRRPNGPPKNPFANARDEADPEFVEWGYGGMGSVKSNATTGNTTMWNKLQSDGRGVVVGDNAEEDDGSGMGWVRRRREERERAQKAQEEEEKKKPEPEQTEEVENGDAPAPSAAGEEHVLRAINIPAPLPRHPHHHRSNSKAHQRTPSADLSTLVGEQTMEEQQKVDTQIVADSEEEISESESESDSASGDKGDDEDDFDDDDDDDDDEDAKRMTSLCAGVEKISRHKEASAAEDRGREQE